MFEIVQTFSEDDISEDFVAIGNLINSDAEAYHAGFVVKQNKQLEVCHYTGKEIERAERANLHPDHWDYLHKRIELISARLVPSFIAHFNAVKRRAKPEYGYFYSGESYDANGNFIGATNAGERMTCVGFCLNVLKGFFEKDYLTYQEWDDTAVPSDFVYRFCSEHGINPESIKGHLRRILPIEAIASAFFVALPIGKQQIESQLPGLTELYLRKRSNESMSVETLEEE